MRTKYSIIAMMVALAPTMSDGAIKRANRANAYQEVNANIQMANAAAIAAIPPTVEESVAALPVRVADENLAKQVATGETDALSVERLERCAALYPSGEMMWAEPTIGSRVGTGAQCVAVVEMIGYQMGANGSNAVLARGYLAAGDAVQCNISAWPDYTYQTAAGTVTFPADAEPTIEQVTAIMDEEQKQNAGLKIAASMIIGGLGGNLAGKAEPGSDKMLGGGKDKLISTAIGAVAGGALATAGSFSGKVAGDTIMGVGMNAAAGAAVGNMAASGDAVLRIERCKLPGDNGRETTCLWGTYTEQKDLASENKVAFFNTSDMKTTIVCKNNNGKFIDCAPQTLAGVSILADIDGKGKTTTQVSKIKASYYATLPDGDFLYFDNVEKTMGTSMNDNGKYLQTSYAGIPTTSVPIAIADIADKPLGVKPTEWLEEIQATVKYKMVYTRNGAELYNFSVDELRFNPSYIIPMQRDAADGGIIDISNKARLKGTGIGAAAGGALGGYAAYEGATAEVQERWVAAVREYKDSLTKFYCQSGTKWMASYNDNAILPTMTE